MSKLTGLPEPYDICEPTNPQLELFFASILKTYARLKELGFIYFNGAVTILEMEEDAHE